MDSEKNEISLEEFRSSISKNRIMTLKIISFALILGPTIFAGVAGFVALEGKESLKLLMTINFVLTGTMFFVSMVIPNMVLKQGTSKLSSVDTILNKIQASHIMSLALVEGAALFGCVCVLLGLGYINYFCLVPLYFTFLKNLPTEKYICRQFILHVKQDSRLLIELEN